MSASMSKYLIFPAVLLAAAVYGQACYQFSGTGVTLQINVDTITETIGPADGTVTYVFSGGNTLTSGGQTQNSTALMDGTINIQVLPAPVNTTTFQMSVPSADPAPVKGQQHTWTVTLAGTGALLSTSLPSPQALPPISSWTGVQNSNIIEIDTAGTKTKYPVTYDGPCGSTGTGGGGQTSANSPTQDLGDPSSIPGDCGCGEPINVGTGNLYYETADYQTAGANPLALIRYYNSLASASGPTFASSLGPNWRTNYDRYLRLSSSTSVIAERPNGQQVTFTLNGSAWTTDSDIDMTLANSGSTWTLTDHGDNVETYSMSGGSEGILQSIRARNGFTLTLTYGGGNQLAAVTDAYNRQLTFLYNSDGSLHTVTTPDGTTMTFGFSSGSAKVLTSIAYSSAGNVGYLYGNSSFPSAITGIVDENGATYISWTYDSTGRALTGQFAGGAGLTTVTYNDTDGSRTVANALGETEVYKFTTLQGIPKVTEVDRQATSTTPAATATYSYDSNGYTSSYTDFNGNTTNYENDSHGQPLTITEAAGTPAARTTTVTYLSNFHLPSQIVTPGLTVGYTYDANGETLTRTLTDTTSNSLPYSTNGQTRTWTYTYANSLLQSIKSPRTDVSAVTQIGYDAAGALSSITNALNQTLQITSHTAGGRPLAMTDSNGVTMKLTYDNRQRLLSTALATAAGTLTSSFTYDAAGNLTGVTQPDGSAITASYDAAHRRTSLADLFNQKLTYTLDGLGDRTKRVWSDANGATQRTSSATLDALGRMLQEIGGANQTTSYSYDADGNPIKQVDPLNHTSQAVFDALNRITSVTDPAGGRIAEAYDAYNRPLSVTDANGATTTFIYDGFGEPIERSSPQTGVTILRYDADGNTVQTMDGRGAVVNYTYDALGRITSQAYPGDTAENVSYTYDESGHGSGVGRLTTLKDAAGTLSFSYDERGNRLSAARVTGSATFTTSYAYDKASRVSAITYPSKTSVAYTRDKMGRITQISAQAAGGSAQTVVSSVTYAPFGPVTGMTYGNGVVETRSFDPDYRMTKVQSAGASTVQSLTYSYDAGNNVASIVDGVTAANKQTLGYDSLDRLISAGGGYGALSFSYDANGNRTKEGSPGSSQDGMGAITGFAYNQSGRLASASAGTQILAQFTYDAFGQRISKQSSNATLIYQYDQDRKLLEEANAQGAGQTDYIYLDGRPVAMISLSTGGQLMYLHGDRSGTPQTATDKNQASAWVANYQPFGALNPSSSQTATLAQDLRFPGQVNDTETGLYQNGFRYYNPAWGRYSQGDPIGLTGGLNPYAYANANPFRYEDPLGLCSVTDAAKAALADLEQDYSNLKSDIQVQYADEQAYGLNRYLQQVPYIGPVVNFYNQDVAPYLPAAKGTKDFYDDAEGASEGEFLGIVGVETTLLRIFFGPLPRFDPATQTFIPAKK